MTEINESDYQAFEEDLEVLVHTLKESFESTDARFYIDDPTDTLFIELEGLDGYRQEEIAEIASPVLGELDLDFEEVILIPLK